MLLRFAVSNFRSIYDPVEFSLIAVDDDRPAARTVSSLNHKVLTTAAIYGPNASGKSNVIDALYWLSNQVFSSMSSISQLIPVRKFKFAEGPQRNSSIEVEMIVDGVRYDYFVEFNEREIVSESLHNYPKLRRRTVFERIGNSIEPSRNLSQRNALQELTTPTTFALSVGFKLQVPEIYSFARAIMDFQYIGQFASRGMGAYLGHLRVDQNPTDSIFYEHYDHAGPTLFENQYFSSSSMREKAMALLRFADMGIQGIRINEFPKTSESDESLVRFSKRRQLQMLHSSGKEQVPFEMTEESLGTQKWFGLIGPLLNALERGVPLVVDELDTSLHPNLSERIINLFRDPQTNPRNAQLIFTTHDVQLFNTLNRDEIWITEKDDSGATKLTGLAEYGGTVVRKDANLERAYLKGKYGGIPFLNEGLLLKALDSDPRL